MRPKHSETPAELPLKDLKIPPEAINCLESIEFAGPIVLVDDEETLQYALKRIKEARRTGFDTESRPAFIKGQKFPVSIIQFSLPDEAFIIKLKKLGLRKEIKEILSDASVEKIGVGVCDDIKRLQELGFFRPGGFTDLADMARKKGLIQSGARSLTARYLGRKLVKSSQKTNWARDGLTERQLRYAATDAWICLHLISPLNADRTDYFALRRQEETGLEENGGENSQAGAGVEA